MEESKEFPVSFSDVQPFTGEPMPVQTVPVVPAMRTQTEYHTAVSVQKPRDLDKIQKAVLREAEIAGDAFYYSWPVKDRKSGRTKQVTGPSIGLAMAAAREWTNCAVPVDYVDTGTEWVFTAHFVDLEKGFTVSRVFRRRKGRGFHQEWSDDRAEDMTFQAAQSRAIRNVIVAGVPRWLTDRAVEKAKEAVVKGMTGDKLAESIDKAVKFLAGYGVSEDRIVAVLNVPRAQWTSEEIIALRGMVSQLKDGQSTADQLFPVIETSSPDLTKKPLSEKIKEELQVKKQPEPTQSYYHAKKQRKPRSDKGITRTTPDDPLVTPSPAPENATTGVSGLLSADQGRRIEELLREDAIKDYGYSKETICHEYEVTGIEMLDQEQGANVIKRLEEIKAGEE